MRYGSVCSGIAAESVAWGDNWCGGLGWECAFHAETAAFPQAVLRNYWPEVALLRDFTNPIIQGFEHGTVDVLVAGTPCQSFSVAGNRGGLADGRGDLALQFFALAGRLRPRWIVWENVPGVLSSNEGRDFASLLAGLEKCGYQCAWSILDAQYFGVAQRRRRLFIVGYLGTWQPAAAVLFDTESMRGDPAPGREAGAGVAGRLTEGFGRRRGCGLAEAAAAGHLMAYGGNDTRGPVEVATALNAHGGPHGRQDFESEAFVTAPLVFDPTQVTSPGNRSNPQPGDPSHPLVEHGHAPLLAFTGKDDGHDAGELAPTLRAMGHDKSHANGGGQVAISVCMATDPINAEELAMPITNRHGDPGTIAISGRDRGDDGRGYGREPHLSGIAGAVDTVKPDRVMVPGMAVRRLTPRECERLQGFPDDYTLIDWRGKPAADGPRYRALGNAMAVPVIRWIGQRIEMVEQILK